MHVDCDVPAFKSEGRGWRWENKWCMVMNQASTFVKLWSVLSCLYCRYSFYSNEGQQKNYEQEPEILCVQYKKGKST
jgi:hypothetical protein